jgi:hypothetical protein
MDDEEEGLRKGKDAPLGLLDSLRVLLGVSERLDVDGIGLVNLVLGSVSDEDGLSSPL